MSETPALQIDSGAIDRMFDGPVFLAFKALCEELLSDRDKHHEAFAHDPSGGLEIVITPAWKREIIVELLNSLDLEPEHQHEPA
ncbi:hypothetical protein EZH22_11335 [Xanthobacter dioxanivorans]|uniref:Uncharacterized protein n=1 Tax=Xanthobacter dioxanivorans TaxID=2528964 RepID=A0A974SL16_9HYPH|nr:hypothetical protein [Xanthobacter dioxanivorans]QRG08814.1 hypothetical protein EZH22_11335 [Xanthobacter dioxanivorans]